MKDDSEGGLLKAVLDLGAMCGWWCIHTRPAWSKRGWRTPTQGNGALGFPDVVMIRRKPVPRLLVAELKRPDGKTTNEQIVWLAHWRAVGAEVHVWRPDDWEEIKRTLAREDVT